MSIDERSPAPLLPREPDALQRLGAALLVSTLLHALLLAWPEWHRPAGRLPFQVRPTPMLASLKHPTAEPTQPLPPAPMEEAPVSVGPKVGTDDTPLSVKARFATPPDLSALEAVPLAGPARLRLRIQVTPQGRAGRMDILESMRVSGDFLAAVTEAISAARFLPGEAGGAPVGSSLELVIEASPQEGDPVAPSMVIAPRP